MPDEDPEIDLKSKKKVSFLELVSSIKCLFPGKEKFMEKLKVCNFIMKTTPNPRKKVPIDILAEMLGIDI